MYNLTISEKLRSRWKHIGIGIINCKVKVHESHEELRYMLEYRAAEIQSHFKIEDIPQLPQIYDGRKAYKAFGKKPARYRLSSEALLRRILKGQGLYFVNNIVDINNLMSLKSYFPICAFDMDHVHPPVEFTLGSKKDHYDAIGRGPLNIENLPVFSDQKGKFGSPTSDSEGVKITEITTSLSMNIVSFSGKDNLEKTLEELEGHLKTFASARETERNIIG